MPSRHTWSGSNKLRALIAIGTIAILWGCGDYSRSTAPSDSDGTGGSVPPLITIIDPGSDTAVAQGVSLVIKGVVEDDFAVDSIFFDITGAQFLFPPVNVNGRQVPFSFVISTAGLGGAQITISITAKDKDGNLGGPAVRVIIVQ